MNIVTVSLAKALLCFANHCYPALVGVSTPVGTYHVTLRITDQAGYGGDVLVYKESDGSLYAIHRVWLLKPQEHRLYRLEHGTVEQRQTVTNGCINIMPNVYEKLKEFGPDVLVISK